MNVEYLIQMLGNRLNALALAKEQAFGIGDLEQINKLDIEVYEVQNTLAKLKLLQIASQEVVLSNNALVESMTVSPIDVASIPPAPYGSLTCLNEYDIEPYATDPLHEQKIADILSYMGSMTSAEEIDAYIDSEAIGSPVTGQMVLYSAQVYAVDARLMLAIMEQDSRFGTAGIAIATLNPGNVGNTGSATRTYSSWSEGVSAVAEWLNRHRKTGMMTTDVADEPQIVSEAPLENQPAPELQTSTSTSVTENPVMENSQSSTSTEQVIQSPVVESTTTSSAPVISDVPSPEVSTVSEPVIAPEPVIVPETVSVPEISPTDVGTPVSEPLSFNLKPKGKKGLTRRRA